MLVPCSCFGFRPSPIPPKGGTAAPYFSAVVYCGQTVAHLSYCWALVAQLAAGRVPVLYSGPPFPLKIVPSHGGAHWRHLANMVNRPCAAAMRPFCRITFTTCFISKILELRLIGIDKNPEFQNSIIAITEYRACNLFIVISVICSLSTTLVQNVVHVDETIYSINKWFSCWLISNNLSIII